MNTLTFYFTQKKQIFLQFFSFFFEQLSFGSDKGISFRRRANEQRRNVDL